MNAVLGSRMFGKAWVVLASDCRRSFHEHRLIDEVEKWQRCTRIITVPKYCLFQDGIHRGISRCWGYLYKNMRGQFPVTATW